MRRALSSVGINTKAVDADEEDGYFRSDLVVYRDRYTDNPFYPNSALDGVTCNACGRSAHLPSTDFTKLVAIARSRLQHVTAEARVVGLFEPDTLQAFRSDNVTGFLRDPEIRSLVVFGPTVSQYFQLIAAPPPPGEQLSNTAYAVGAVIVLTLCIAAFLFAAWIRRRFVNEGAP